MLAYYALSELSPLKKYFYVNNLGIAVFAAELICMFAVNISRYSAAVIFVTVSYTHLTLPTNREV